MNATDTTAPEAPAPGIFQRMIQAIVLPKEITKFEQSYLRKMNKVALAFFYAHLPVFAGIAWLNDTGPLLALALTSLVLVGPTLAYKTFSSPRATSLTFGFAAMCMGGLLVHFGQGPVQIEMHFYFFSVLAMLALFGNPMTIVVAAATVSVHHLALWAFLPESVFNYDAPIWVVLVHAAFVVLETFAACYIARNFFDNVIGLELIVEERTREVEARNRDMRLVMDNVSQGFLTMNADGSLSAERSAVVDEWFGGFDEGETFVGLLERISPHTALWFQLGWDSVVEGFLPLEVTISQLPARFGFEGREFRAEYTPILAEGSDGELQSLLIVLTDITIEVERAAAEQEQRETLSVFERIMKDRDGFLEFYEEATRLVGAVTKSEDPSDALTKREIHTLKGNAGVFGLHSVAALCHDVEEHLADGEVELAKAGLEQLLGKWTKISETFDRLLGTEARETISITPDEFQDILQAVIDEEPSIDVAKRLINLRLEPTELRLNRFADQARALAERLQKGAIEVRIEPSDLRLERERFAEFWQSFVHVLRNAVDHGIEAPDQRAEVGKPEQGVLELKTFVEGEDFVVELQDDGRGIDWDAIRGRAEELGIEHDSVEELLFHDGLSTLAEASQTSGRGVGMGAAKSTCEALGGTVTVSTEAGSGTCVQFRFPADLMVDYSRTH